MKLAIDHITSRYWAITADHLNLMLEIASKDAEINSRLETFEKRIEAISDEKRLALKERLGVKMANTDRVYIRDNVAVIDVMGPLFRYANLFTELCGATSYELLSRDIAAASKNPMVSSIILYIDSPGGEVNGCWEIANQIHKLNASGFPIYSYVSGMACSGGYWIASATKQIFASPTSVIGSIGVQATYTVRGDSKGDKSIRIVSSQSPLKNVSPETEEGIKQIQTEIDDLAQVFIDSVALHRNVKPAVVAETFGRGGVFVGKKALHMVDTISNFENVLIGISRR